MPEQKTASHWLAKKSTLPAAFWAKKVVLDIQDDQDTPDGAVLAATKLYSTDMVALLGPNKSSYVKAMDTLIKDGGKPCICWGTSPVISANNTNPWLFFGRPSDIVTATNAAKFMAEDLKCKKVGIFYNNDDYGAGCKNVLTKTLDSLGVAYVAEGHNTSDKDFTSQLQKFKSEGCDVVTSWAHSAEVAIFARQRFELGMTDIKYVGSVSVSESNTADLLDANMLEGVYSVCDFSPDVQDPVMSEIIKKCQEKFKYVPNVMYMACHSTLYTVCWAVEKAGSTDPAAIKAALATLDGTQIKTGEGAMKFMPNQVLTSLSLVIQYDNAKKLKTVKQL